MSSLQSEVLNANKQYAEDYKTFGTFIVPHKKLAIVTCMDARLDPISALGLKVGDANVMRNAGAHIRDAARSILLSIHVLGIRTVYIVKHTDCGMLKAAPEPVRAVMKQNLGLDESKDIDNFEVGFISDLEESCRSDVAWLRANPFQLKDVEVVGWIFETETGKLRKVVE